MSEQETTEWNDTNSWMQGILRDDPACQGMAVELEPVMRLLVVVEPGRVLSAASVAAIEMAKRLRPVAIVQGVTEKDRLEAARRAIDDATRRVPPPPDTKGLVIGTDWRIGKVRLTGDTRHAQAIVDAAVVDRELVIVEDGPAMRRR
jgi:hypothetical protein